MKSKRSADNPCQANLTPSILVLPIVLYILLFPATTLPTGFPGGPMRPEVRQNISGKHIHQTVQPEQGLENLKVVTSRQKQTTVGQNPPPARPAPAIPGTPPIHPRTNPLKLHPDLTISRILFAPPSCKPVRPKETCVKVVIRNIGTAPSSPTTVTGILRRGDGSTERNSLPVPALKPGNSTTLEGPLRFTTGRNTLTMEVKDRYNRKNNRLSRSHVVSARGKDRNRLPGKTVLGTPRFVDHDTLAGIGSRRKIPRPGPQTGDPPAYLPDIEIVSVRVKTVNSSRPYWKKVLVKLRNIGGQYDGTAHPCTLRLNVTGPLGEEPDQEKIINETITAQEKEYHIYLPEFIAHGQYTVQATAHLVHQEELRRDNNAMSKGFSLEPLPDLAILLSHPGDVRVGKKKWFRLRVKNIGQAPSGPARLKLHINRDGDHFYDIPPLQPGENYPKSGKKSIQRGIKWWKKGKKKYYAQITYNHPEIRRDNNRVESSLHVYLPAPARFDPIAHVQACPRITLKQHSGFMAGRNELLTFLVHNPFGQVLSSLTRVSIYLQQEGSINGLPVRPELLTEFEVGPLFPSETKYRTLRHRFSLPGHYKIMVDSINRRHRNWGKCTDAPVEIASFSVEAIPMDMPTVPQRE